MFKGLNERFINHQVSDTDLIELSAIRLQLAPVKGMLEGPQARDSFDQMMEITPVAAGVKYQAETVGGVPGTWCRLKQPKSSAVILYLHGGGYVVGTANAYRHLAGQFAARTGLDAYVADYGLAPEHPFPTALNHVKAVYVGLVEAGYRQIVVVGDSAGGGLSLSLAAWISDDPNSVHGIAPACCAIMSPWTDLTLTGDSHEALAEEELFLTRAGLEALAYHYLAGHDPRDPVASPLFGLHEGLPPLQIHVGTAEILLSDTLEFAKRALEAGATITTHIWEAMPHVFPNGFAQLEAAEHAMAMMSEFIVSHLKD